MTVTETLEVPETREAPAAPSPAAAESLTFAKALNTALADEMDANPAVVMFGEDVGPLGGVFRITDGLTARFGEIGRAHV